MLEPSVLGELLGRPVSAVRREPFEPPGWSSTDAVFERVALDGEPEPSLVAKTTRRDYDWVAVATDDTVDREVRCWEAGLLARLPAPMTHAVVGAARTDHGYTLLMHDVSRWLMVNTAAAPASWATHQLVLEALAAMHARFWLDEELQKRELGLSSLAGFVNHTSPSTIEQIRLKGGASEALDIAEEGWRRLPLVSDPSFAADVQWLAEDPALLVSAAARLPWTLVHADPRSDNLAIDGERVILLDWGRPAVAPPALDLAYWLVAGNQHGAIPHDRLIAAYEAALRARLGRRRFSDAWWEPQLRLCLLAVFVAMAPFIARFHPEATPWWMERVRPELWAIG